MRPRGRPHTPSAKSRPNEPVEMTCTPFWASTSPSFMMAPSPNSLRIWERTASSAELPDVSVFLAMAVSFCCLLFQKGTPPRACAARSGGMASFYHTAPLRRNRKLGRSSHGRRQDYHAPPAVRSRGVKHFLLGSSPWSECSRGSGTGRSPPARRFPERGRSRRSLRA